MASKQVDKDVTASGAAMDEAWEKKSSASVELGRGGATCKLVSRSSSAALTSDDGRVNSVRGRRELYDFFCCSIEVPYLLLTNTSNLCKVLCLGHIMWNLKGTREKERAKHPFVSQPPPFPQPSFVVVFFPQLTICLALPSFPLNGAHSRSIFRYSVILNSSFGALCVCVER